MATEFSREFFADNRIVKASLRCAHKLREKDLDRIKSEIKKLYDATEVILNITVDESLLSGYVLQVGDRVFDNSGRHQLDKMMEGKPSLATLKTRIEDYKPAETSAEGGVVISSADGIVHIDGMNRAVYGEIVTFENGAKGMVESVEPEQLGVMLFDGAETVGVGTMVTRSGKRAGIPVVRQGFHGAQGPRCHQVCPFPQGPHLHHRRPGQGRRDHGRPLRYPHPRVVSTLLPLSWAPGKAPTN